MRVICMVEGEYIWIYMSVYIPVGCRTYSRSSPGVACRGR